MTPMLTDDGVVATLMGGSGIDVSTSTDATVNVALHDGLAGVCNNAQWIPTEPAVTLPAGVQSGTAIQITQPDTTVTLQSGDSSSIGFQWYVVNAHTTSSVTIGVAPDIVVYGPRTVQPLQCALVRQCSTDAFLVIASFQMDIVVSLLTSILSTEAITCATPGAIGVTTHPDGSTLILSTAAATVVLTPNPATAGWHWYVANATDTGIPIIAGTDANDETAVVFGGSSIPEGRAILIRQFSVSRFVIVGITPIDPLIAMVFNSTVGVSGDGLLQLPDDMQHPNGSTILLSGTTAGTSVRIVGSDTGISRSWYVVNNMDVEVPIIPTATTLVAPDLQGSTYIPVGAVLWLRQYSATGYMSIISRPDDATPHVLSGGSTIPMGDTGEPIRNGTTIDLSNSMDGDSWNIYSDARTVGYTWFLNNNSTQPMPLIPSKQLPTDTLPTVGVSTASVSVPVGQMALLHQTEASRYLLVLFETPRTVCKITINNTTLDGGHANRFCLLNLTGTAPFGIVLSKSQMLDGGEIEVFNNCGSNITFTSASNMLSRRSEVENILPDKGGLFIKYLEADDAFVLLGCLL
jgi:hypothetical protein